MAAIFGHRQVQLVQPLQQYRKVDRRETADPGAGLDLGDAQQRGEQGQHLVGVLERPPDRRRIVPDPARLVARRLQAVAQPRQRRAQVVCHVAGDLLQVLEQLGDAVEHVVDGTGQAVPLVVPTAQRECARRTCPR